MPTCPTCQSVYPLDVLTCAVDGSSLQDGADLSTRSLEHPPPPLAAAAELTEGQMVGEYRIEAKLGEGGFGTVYRAVHPLIKKRVAIKVLNMRMASSRDGVSRFIAEARAVNQIRHRNIVDIYSFGVLDDGRHYFVMDLLEGITLRAHLRQNGRMNPRQAVDILRPLARALDAAHAVGIAHRDLKPDNVFLVMEADGQVFPKLIDFGLAKLDHEGDLGHRTRSGAPIGTPRYMSPEQCRGLAVDFRADIYSLGVVVHEMLTGRCPFEGGGLLDVMVQHTTAPPPPVSTLRPDLPVALDLPILQMLAKDPDHRPITAEAAVAALAAALSESGAAPGSPALATGDEAPVKRRTLAVVATLIGIAAIGGLAVLSATARHPPLTATPVSTGGGAEGGQAKAAAARPDQMITLQIHSSPALVDVYLGAERVGTSASPLLLPRGDARVTLTARAAGFASADLEVTPNANGFLSVTLARAPAPARRPSKATPSELESPFHDR